MASAKLTAAIYVRVSTEEQKHDLQLQELRQYARRMGWKVIEYAEKMSSVKVRPILKELFQDARLRKLDVVLVWKLDRFARSLKELLANIQLLDSMGVRFICVTQGIDTDKRNPMATFIMQIMGAFAEFERAIIVERVKAGITEARRQGKPFGRRRRVFRRDRAIAMRKAGMTFRAIAAELKVPLSTVADEISGKVRKTQ